jgi:hypothetical protein
MGFLYGSDQMVWPNAMGKSVRHTRHVCGRVGLTEEEQQAIFYDNAVRLLRLDEKKPG